MFIVSYEILVIVMQCYIEYLCINSIHDRLNNINILPWCSGAVFVRCLMNAAGGRSFASSSLGSGYSGSGSSSSGSSLETLSLAHWVKVLSYRGRGPWDIDTFDTLLDTLVNSISCNFIGFHWLVGQFHANWSNFFMILALARVLHRDFVMSFRPTCHDLSQLVTTGDRRWLA